MIVAGRQLDPELREPLAHLARVAGFPILAEPTSQLRCGAHDRSHVVAAYDLLLRDEHFASSVVPDLILRFGAMPTSKPLRAWLASQRRRPDRRRPLRRLERADPPGGGDPPRRPDRAGRRLGGAGGERRGRERRRERWLEAESGGPAPRSTQSSPAQARDHRARPPPRARRRPPRRRPRLHGLEHADPRPGGLPRRRRSRRPLPLQPRRQRDRRPGLLRHRRRPRPAAGRRRSSPATSAYSTTSAASPRCATSRPRSGSS